MRVLLVEDNPLDMELVQHALEREVPDLRLQTATSVQQALHRLQPGEPFDVVVTDLRLPDGSGLDVLNHIRQAQLPHAVVVLTGQGDEETAVSAIKAGADDYMAKRNGYQKQMPQIIAAAIDRFRQESQRKTGLLRVLYAEHHPADIELTRRHLARHAPHIQLQIALSSADALARLDFSADQESAYDVLLLDFNLPDGNALEILKIVHGERHLALPIVLVTGQGDEEVAAQALRLGATDYIVKNAGYLYELPVALENAHHRASLARQQAALIASEERFRRLAENAPDLIFRYSYVPTPHFEYVSPAAERLTGYTPAEHYADPQLGYKLVYADDRPLLEATFNDNWDFSQPTVLRLVRKDGEIIWTEQRSTPLYDGNGRLRAIEGIARDVTHMYIAAAEMQQHLAEMQALYRVSNALRTAQTVDETVQILLNQTLTALNTDAGAVWLYDKDAGNLRMAAAGGWCRQVALSTLAPGEGITGQVFANAAEFVAEDVALSPQLLASLRPYIPKDWSGGWAPIRTSDEIVGVLFVAAPRPHRITDAQIKLVISLGEMAGSIMQRLRLLQDAQAQAELTRQIVNTVPEGLMLLDSSGRVLLTNAPGQKFLAEVSALDKSGAVVAIAGRNRADLLFGAGGEWQEIEHQERAFILNAQPVEPGLPGTSWVIVIDEVTKERQQKRYQDAQDRLATVGQLAAGIAHDFNNVLGIISVYADIMQTAPNLTAKQQGQMATVVEQAHHAANLVRQVLDFSRRSVMERSSIDLYPLVNEQVKLLARTLPESIQLRFHADEKHIYVNADPTRLRQVLMNLAINARDAMPQGGMLTFTLSHTEVDANAKEAAPLPDMAPGRWVRLVVADTGSGITPDHLPHLFEPFFTTKGPGQGSGLGLAQVYGIVKQHDGAITVSSTPGQGAQFTIYLPAGHEQAPATTHTDRPAGGGSECILLVEDNVDLCQAVGQSLETLGYKVLAAFEGATALHLAAQPNRTVDLVLSDMVMPGWNGLDLYAALLRHQPGATLLIMTGHPLSPAHVAALQDQAGHWIQKPFTLVELAGRVRLALDQASSGSPPS